MNIPTRVSNENGIFENNQVFDVLGWVFAMIIVHVSTATIKFVYEYFCLSCQLFCHLTFSCINLQD